jgi:hypothetical protein
MGKFSERINRTLGRRKRDEARPNWSSAIGNGMDLAVEILELGPDQAKARLLEARCRMGRIYEDQVRDLLRTLRVAAEKQLEIADRALQLVDDCSRQVDEEVKPRLVS